MVYLGYSLFFTPLSPDYGLPSLCVPGKFVMHFQRVSGALLGQLSHSYLKTFCGGGKVFRKIFAVLMKETTGAKTGVKQFGGPVF